MAEALEPGRRQRRWNEVHDRLYESAAGLFVAQGYGPTSFDEIADTADVARKTAFNHFPRKKDFIREWGNRRRAQAAAAVTTELLQHPDFEHVIRRYLTEMSLLSTTSRPLTQSMMEGWRESGGPFDGDSHVLIDVFTELVCAARERGEVDAGVSDRRAANLLYTIYFGVLFDWCEGDVDSPPFDLSEELMAVLDVVLRGMMRKVG